MDFVVMDKVLGILSLGIKSPWIYSLGIESAGIFLLGKVLGILSQ
jgi:hypothetical protein